MTVMKTAYKQAYLIEVRKQVAAALSLVKGAFLDEVGAGQLMDAAAQLDSAAFHCRMVSLAVSEEIRAARLAARIPADQYWRNAFQQLSAEAQVVVHPPIQNEQKPVLRLGAGTSRRRRKHSVSQSRGLQMFVELETELRAERSK